MSDLRAKEIKRAALNECLDYISNYKGVLSEPVYPELIRMVRVSTLEQCSLDRVWTLFRYDVMGGGGGGSRH